MMKGAKENMIDAIGNTPIVKLSNKFTGVESEIYVKLEYLNPGGSTKDRIGVYMIDQAVKNGNLKPGGTIIEGTSGNTGVGIAIYAALHGYKCIFVLNDKQSKEKIDNLKAYGAKVVVCPTDVQPEDPRSYYSVSKRLAKTVPNSYYVNQYDNLWNRETHYKFTAPEIHQQTGGEFDIFMAAVGTGGTITGCAKYFKENLPHVKSIAVDCEGSILTHYFKTGEMIEAKTYVLEGIGEDFIPENYDFDVIDDFLQVGDKESFLMTRRLLKEQAVYTGGSAGAAVLAAIKYAKTLKEPKRILILLHDSGNRYASKIFNDDWMTERGYWQSSYNQSVKEARENMKREELMYVDAQSTLRTVVDIMSNNDFSNIPVISDNQVVGVVRDSDIIQPLFDGILNYDDNVATVYSQHFVAVPESETLNSVVMHLKDRKSVVITDINNGKPIDLFTKNDLLKLMGE